MSPPKRSLRSRLALPSSGWCPCQLLLASSQSTLRATGCMRVSVACGRRRGQRDRVSLTFEFSVPARFDSVQETDYSIVYRTDNQHRDIVFSGLFQRSRPADWTAPLGIGRWSEHHSGRHAAKQSRSNRIARHDPGTLRTFWTRDSADTLDDRFGGGCRYRDSGQSPRPDRSTDSAALGLSSLPAILASPWTTPQR
jgi:hypothetical protein